MRIAGVKEEDLAFGEIGYKLFAPTLGFGLGVEILHSVAGISVGLIPCSEIENANRRCGDLYRICPYRPLQCTSPAGNSWGCFYGLSFVI